uniref:Aspartic proteinase nepenthesin-1 n=1 Tax=Aegilops tauschii TaxID=37682 RepID=M8BHM6_AEGTA
MAPPPLLPLSALLLLLLTAASHASAKPVVKVPTVSMHFAGGAEAALPPENYLIPVDSKGTFCFAFAGTDGGVSIIGNIQQQGFRVVFDGDGQRVAFVPKGC